MRFGLDVHGVIDKHPQVFAAVAKALVEANHEVHIITGPTKSYALWDLAKAGFVEGVHYTHFCSIIDYRASQGITVSWDERGHGWLRPELWDSAKAEYCQEVGLDLHIDDSETYGKHFKSSTLYLRKEGREAQRVNNIKEVI